MPRDTGKKQKPALKKSEEKPVLRQATEKKSALTTPAAKAGKKKAVVKRGLKKKTSSPQSDRIKTGRKHDIPVKENRVEPGPPPGSVPPVEEPFRKEEALGTVAHYYSHLGVAVVQINKGTLKTGDMIRLAGNSTDFMQKVESLEYEHQHVDEASAGQCVGIKVQDHAREHDIVYLVK